MRTTLTIDQDVFMRLREYMATYHLPLKTAVNQLIRQALAVPATRQRVTALEIPVRRAQQPGLRPGFSWDMANAEWLDQLDTADADV